MPIQSVRGLQIGKGTGAAADDLKRLEIGGDVAHDAADIGCFGIRHIAQELERQVHLLRANPVDLGSRHAQFVDQIAGAVQSRGATFRRR